jgi:hypothetical protein
VCVQDIRRVLDPGNAKSTDDCAPAGVEEQARAFFENGFVIVRGAIAGEKLARVQSAWDQLEVDSRPVSGRSMLYTSRHTIGCISPARGHVCFLWQGVGGSQGTLLGNRAALFSAR